MTRRQALQAIAGGGLVGAGLAGGYLLRDLFHAADNTRSGRAAAGSMMSGSMMGSATAADMRDYTELFERHGELRRRVELIPGGVRTVTESDAPELVAQLQAHVASMYEPLNRGAEVRCMSSSLPTLFHNHRSYRRTLTITAHGVAVTETSHDRRLVSAIREHAREVTGFVRDGMRAMMHGMIERRRSAPLGLR